MMRNPDGQLVRRLGAGDRAAYEAVVEQHYASIYRQLWHLCGERETAADLTQETFVQAWQSLPSFRGRSSLRTWLYTIAVRTWHRWRARQERGDPETLETLAETLPDPAPDPLDQVSALWRHAEVQQALLRLSPAYRETIVLFYLQELKYHEVAEALGVPIGTVKSRLHTGLQRLRAELTARSPEEVNS